MVRSMWCLDYWLAVRGLHCLQGPTIFVFSKMSRHLLIGFHGFLFRVSRSGHEAVLPLPSSAKVTNEWMNTSTLHVCLHGLYRDNLTLYRLIFVIDIQHVFSEEWIEFVNIGRISSFSLPPFLAPVFYYNNKYSITKQTLQSHRCDALWRHARRSTEQRVLTLSAVGLCE